MGDLASNINKYKVLTPDGYKDFAGVSFMGDKLVYKLEFEKGVIIECTEDHKLYQNLQDYKEAKDFQIGDEVLTSDGYIKLLNREYKGILPVFDLVEVADGHRYYANTVLGSNCEFLIFDETLINSLKIYEMQGCDPIETQGQVRWWKKPTKDHVYLIALDPSMGTGGDNAGIQVFEMPDMIQVGEWMHNKTPITKQVKILQSISQYILEKTDQANNIYYSVENNSLGEAALVSIAELGEENIPGTFLSEPRKVGTGRRFRKGFNTTSTTKNAACAKFKSLVETDRMKINSKPLISEIKNFVAKGSGYEAREGEHDDLVMSSILAVRMAVVLQHYDPKIESHLRDHLDEIQMPMPFIVM